MAPLLHPLNITAEDIMVLAMTILGEAGGEPFAGKAAVAYVAITRAEIALEYFNRFGKEHPLFGNGSLAVACTEPEQFSAWNTADPARRLIFHKADLSQPEFRDCYCAALCAITGQVPSQVGGATHYLNPLAVAKLPAWAEGAHLVATIARHQFFDRVP